MRQTGKDVFISYRREAGDAMPRLVKQALEQRGFTVFFDVYDHFDTSLLKDIARAPNFVVMLSRDTLKRCANQGDWVRQEIAHAIATERRIVPIMEKGFSLPSEDDLPLDIAELARHQGVVLSHSFFNATIDKLVAFLKPPQSPLAPRNAHRTSGNPPPILEHRPPPRQTEKTPRAQDAGTAADDKAESSPRQRQWDVFISAKSADYPAARQVYEFLETQGLTVFLSDVCLPQLGRADYRREIDRAIDNACHMVVVTSSKANVESPWVEAEWGAFINEKRSSRKQGELVTVRAENLHPSSLPLSLRQFESVSLDSAGLKRLLGFVRPRRPVGQTGP